MKVRIAQPYHDKEIEDSVLSVLRSGRLVSGPIVESFEEAVAEYLDVNNVVAVSSGTASLHLSLLSLDIKPGQEVITTPFSFPATAISLPIHPALTEEQIDYVSENLHIALR